MKKLTLTEEQIRNILERARDGEALNELCEEFNFSRSTYYRWKADQSFKLSLDNGPNSEKRSNSEFDLKRIDVCDKCGVPLSPRVVEFCRSAARNFKGKLYCVLHQ